MFRESTRKLAIHPVYPILIAALFSSLGVSAQTNIVNTSPPAQTITNSLGGAFNVKSNDCFLSGTLAGCETHSATYNGPRITNTDTHDNLAVENYFAYGPAPTSLSHSVHQLRASNTYCFVRDICQTFGFNMYKHGLGDWAGIRGYGYGDGGFSFGSDEGMEAAAFNFGEFLRYPYGTISGGTGLGSINPTLSIAVCTGCEQNVADGNILLDITRGTILGNFAGTSGTVPGTMVPYINVTGVSLPLTTAFGTTNAAISPTAGPPTADSSITLTVTLGTIGSSTPAFVVGSACIAGATRPQQTNITNAGSVSGGIQSITFTAHYPNPTSTAIFQGGVCGSYVSYDADYVFSGFRTSYYAFGSLTGSDLIWGIPVPNNQYSNVAAPPIGSGLVAETATGSFHLYPGAEVLSTGATGTSATLEPNEVNWALNDSFEEPHNQTFEMRAIYAVLDQDTPNNPSFASSGFQVYFSGHGMNSAFRPFESVNNNPCNYYSTCTSATPGPLIPPDLITVVGSHGAMIAVSDGFPTALMTITGGTLSDTVYNFPIVSGFLDYEHLLAPITSYSISSNVITLNGTFQNIAGYDFSAGRTISLTGFPTSTFLNGQICVISSVTGTTAIATLSTAHGNVSTTVEGGKGYALGLLLGGYINVPGSSTYQMGTGDLAAAAVQAYSGEFNTLAVKGNPVCTFANGLCAGSGGLISVANGGTGTSTAPSAGDILVAQSATAYTPEPLGGDCTLASAGAITCTKTNGTLLGTMATQNASSIAVTGGTINSTSVGGTTPAAGTFTGLGITGTTSTTSTLTLTTPGGLTNEKNTVLSETSPGSPFHGYFSIVFAPDSPGTGSQPLTITRSGTTATQISLSAPVTAPSLAINGALSAGSISFGIGALGPATVGPAAGTGASATSGLGQSGVLTVTTGTSPLTNGLLVTVPTSASVGTYGCTLMARNGAAASQATSVFTLAPTMTGWSVQIVNGSLVASTAYSWSFICF